jgi:hypothetical protein
VTVTFSSVQAAGQVAIDPLSPSALQPFPDGCSLIADAGVAYNISTTAQFSSPVTTCIATPSISDQSVFSSLRILHLENGALVDRTILSPAQPAPNFSTRQICASTTTLGAFVVAQLANQTLPSIAGLVTDSNDNPLSDIPVSLTRDRTLSTQTDSNGQWRM